MIELALTILIACFVLAHVGALVLLSALALAAVVATVAAVVLGWGAWHVLAPLGSSNVSGLLVLVLMVLGAVFIADAIAARLQRGRVGQAEARVYGGAFLALFVMTASLLPAAIELAMDGRLEQLALGAATTASLWAMIASVYLWRAGNGRGRCGTQPRSQA